MNPTDFLSLVWGRQKGYVHLPYKEGAVWHEQPGIRNPPTNGDLQSALNGQASRDQYFCPMVFRGLNRRKSDAQSTHWLWADLDPVDPRSLKLRPTVAWSSSPGRYQALWRLDRRIQPDRHSRVNRRLSYAIGADKGGWDITQVLRLPGSRNHKPEYGPKARLVRLLWSNGPSHAVADVERYLKGVEAHLDVIDEDAVGVPLPAESRESILQRVRPKLHRRAIELLDADPDRFPVGDEGRSGLLWELECRLFEAGLEPGEVFIVVRDSVWNKFRERNDGDSALWREVRKAHLHVGATVEAIPDSGSGLLRVRPRIITYGDLLGTGISEPDWLVEEWWTLGSHGVIAGLPKSYKSLVTLDLAVSVASDTPFLGLHEVNTKGVGPVLIIQQENSLPLLRDRLWKIGRSRGLHQGVASTDESGTTLRLELPTSIPIYFYNNFTFDMSYEADRVSIEEMIQKYGVKLVVFDPLYLMIGGADENSAQEMRPILSWLLRLRNLYGCAVVVVHHWGKGAPGRGGRGVGGQRLLGSTTIYGWLEAALYLEADRKEDGSFQVTVEREFRERPSPPPIGFSLEMGDIGEHRYQWKRLAAIGTTNRVLIAVREAGTKGATLDFVKSRTKMGQKRVSGELSKLIDDGKIKKEKPDNERAFRYWEIEDAS